MSVLSDARPKLAQRSAQRRRRLVIRLLPLLGAVALLAAVAWIVFLSSWLGVGRVVVDGAARVSVADVERVAAVETGTPLARVDTGAVSARVATLQPVADVQVVRRWPRTIRIVVTERVPFAVVEIDGVNRLVDRGGVAFDNVTAKERRLPRLRTATPGPQDVATQAGLDVLAALPPAVLSRVQRIDVPGPEQVTLRLAGGKRVVWGSAAETEKKAAVLNGVLRQAGTVYDVSTPDVVTVR